LIFFEISNFKPCVDDTFCGKNNIVVVKKSDFEVMEALTMDSIQQQAQKSSNSKSIMRDF
jgi:hypothetical protein